VVASDALAAVMRERNLPAPNVDFALATLARAADMTRGASEAIMALARIAGWLAHALEEYQKPTRFPIRALYVGS
jgi:citrate synthase